MKKQDGKEQHHLVFKSVAAAIWRHFKKPTANFLVWPEKK
jgi:hypothetical protein